MTPTMEVAARRQGHLHRLGVGPMASLILITIFTASLRGQSTQHLEQVSRGIAKALGTPNHVIALQPILAGKFLCLVESPKANSPVPPVHIWRKELARLEADFLAFMPTPKSITVPAGSLRIIVLRTRARYDRYLAKLPRGKSGAIHGHFEPAAMRMVLPATASLKTLRHEATHLLLDAYRPASLRTGVRVFWFEEGLAAYLGGTPNAQGHYQPGLDHRALQRALASTRALFGENSEGPPRPPLTLRQLLDATLATAKGWVASPRSSPHPHSVTQQASAFIHFLTARTKDLNAKRAAANTKALNTYLSYQVLGAKGAPFNDRAAFRRAFGLESPKSFAAFEQEWKAAWSQLIATKRTKPKSRPQNPR